MGLAKKAGTGAVAGSAFGPWGTAIGAGLGAGMELWNTWQSKKQQDWQKEAQKITWAREDNARQRAVADMRTAGLSPTLAAGSPAATSVPTRPEAPQSKQEKMLNLLQMRANIAETQASARSKMVQADVDEATRNALEQIVWSKYGLAYQQHLTQVERTQEVGARGDTSRYNLERSRKFGLRTNDTGANWVSGAMMGDQGLNNLLDILGKMKGK